MTDGPILLVAGASSGMGRATARHLGKGSGHIILAARRQDLCEEAAEQIRAEGGSAEAMAFDGTDAASVAALIAQIDQKHGRLDGAFNNIGNTMGDGPLHEMPLDQWDASMAVNLSSIFYLLRAQVPLMLRGGGGRIVNNSSTGGVQGTPNMADYSAAKWGVIGLTKSAAKEYSGQGIAINVIAPGIIATERFQEIAANIPEVFEKLAAETPIGRFGAMEEIAATVDWLLRAAPAYMTGTVLPLDGGRTA